MGMGGRGVRFPEEEREWRLLDHFYADDLVLCGESEEDLRAIVRRFFEVCRRGLKVNAGKSNVQNGNERLGYEAYVAGILLDHASEFKYFRCVLVGTECSRKVASGRRVLGSIRSLVNDGDLQLECAIDLHKTLLVPVLMYGSEKMLWKEKERSR